MHLSHAFTHCWSHQLRATDQAIELGASHQHWTSLLAQQASSMTIDLESSTKGLHRLQEYEAHTLVR